jgi:hypothetical protein
MLRKIMIFTCLFSTTISAISIYTDSFVSSLSGKRVYESVFEYRAEYGTQLDWVQMGFVALAVSSFLSLFFTRKREPNKTDINKNEVEYFDSKTGEPVTNNTQQQK